MREAGLGRGQLSKEVTQLGTHCSLSLQELQTTHCPPELATDRTEAKTAAFCSPWQSLALWGWGRELTSQVRLLPGRGQFSRDGGSGEGLAANTGSSWGMLTLTRKGHQEGTGSISCASGSRTQLVLKWQSFLACRPLGPSPRGSDAEGPGWADNLHFRQVPT